MSGEVTGNRSHRHNNVVDVTVLLLRHGEREDEVFDPTTTNIDSTTTTGTTTTTPTISDRIDPKLTPNGYQQARMALQNIIEAITTKEQQRQQQQQQQKEQQEQEVEQKDERNSSRTNRHPRSHHHHHHHRIQIAFVTSPLRRCIGTSSMMIHQSLPSSLSQVKVGEVTTAGGTTGRSGSLIGTIGDAAKISTGTCTGSTEHEQRSSSSSHSPTVTTSPATTPTIIPITIMNGLASQAAAIRKNGSIKALSDQYNTYHQHQHHQATSNKKQRDSTTTTRSTTSSCNISTNCCNERILPNLIPFAVVVQKEQLRDVEQHQQHQQQYPTNPTTSATKSNALHQFDQVFLEMITRSQPILQSTSKSVSTAIQYYGLRNNYKNVTKYCAVPMSSPFTTKTTTSNTNPTTTTTTATSVVAMDTKTTTTTATIPKSTSDNTADAKDDHGTTVSSVTTADDMDDEHFMRTLNYAIQSMIYNTVPSISIEIETPRTNDDAVGSTIQRVEKHTDPIKIETTNSDTKHIHNDNDDEDDSEVPTPLRRYLVVVTHRESIRYMIDECYRMEKEQFYQSYADANGNHNNSGYSTPPKPPPPPNEKHFRTPYCCIGTFTATVLSPSLENDEEDVKISYKFHHTLPYNHFTVT